MKQYISSMILIFIALFPIGGLAQDLVWVSSTNAKLLQEKKATAPTVSVLPLHTELQILAKEKKWYHIQTKAGLKGWIYQGKVTSSKPPQADSSSDDASLDNLFAGLTGSSIENSNIDSSRSIRGLSPNTEEYATKTGTSPKVRQALNQILTRTVSQQEVDHFLQNAKIGEYAE